MTVGTGAGLLWWYNHEKEQKLEEVGREGKGSVVVGQVRGGEGGAGVVAVGAPAWVWAAQHAASAVPPSLAASRTTHIWAPCCLPARR